MGFLIKFFIIAFVIIYIFARFAGFFLRGIFWLMGKNPVKAAEQRAHSQHSETYRPNDGNVSITYDKKTKQRKPFTGGEYVDFEEVD